MGCASSTPMVQTTGSEMLKAATHVASDATKSAGDAVEDMKDAVGKTLETTKDAVATTVENVKHEVENVVKEKTEMLEDAKNTLIEKLHLKQTENESNEENGNKTEGTDERKTQLSENSKPSIDNQSEVVSETLKQTVAIKDIKEHVLTRTNTETDSLKTSTPEPEIEEALAKSNNNQDDEDDNPPTPKPTLTEFENLTAEFLKGQRQQEDTASMVNDTKNNNDPPSMSVVHQNIKTLDSNSQMPLTGNNNTIENNEPTTTATLTINEIKSNNMHSTPQVATAVHTNSLQPLLTMATSAIATVKAATITTKTTPPQFKMANEKENFISKVAPLLPAQQAVLPPLAPLEQGEKQEKLKITKQKEADKENESIEKRPGTTEWEKFADMLAQMRKFNPHDAFLPTRRTKFGAGGFGQLRERSYVGHIARNGVDEDSSDTNSILHGSPVNSQRSSARAAGRGQRLSNRPNTGNNRKKHNNEFYARNGGGNNPVKSRRSSNVVSTIGRKFDFNPSRTRVSEYVSSAYTTQSSLYTAASTQLLYAPYSNANESVKSPTNMRRHQPRNETISLPALDAIERTSLANQNHQHHHQHLEHDNASFPFDHNDSSILPLHNDIYSNKITILTRQSSNASLFSKSSCLDDIQQQSERLLSTNQHVSTMKNTSSFLTTPRSSPFSLRKSYTDLYFSTTVNKENKLNTSSELASNHKSPFKVHTSSKKHCRK